MKVTHPSDSTFGVARLRRWVFLVIVCTILARPHSISAADYYWDADPAANNLTTGAGLGGAGVWNASNLNWWDTSTSADVVWPGAAHRAVFWGTAGTVAVNDMSASGLLIKSTAGSYTLTGNGGGTARTLTLGAEGITMESGAAATILGNNTGNGRLLFGLSANQTWLNSSANALTVNGTVNLGATTLTLANDSTGGQVFSQAFIGTGGIVIDSSGSGETLFSGANSGFGGTITIKRGTLVAGNVASAIGAAGSTVTLGGGSDDATLRFQNTQTYLAKIAVAAGAGKRTISASTGGSSSISSGGIAVDNDLNLRIAGAGTLNITGSLTGAGNILVDAAPGADGYIQLAVSNTAYTGNITIRSGLVRAASFSAALGSGTVYLGDASTAGDALLQYITATTFTTPDASDADDAHSSRLNGRLYAQTQRRIYQEGRRSQLRQPRSRRQLGAGTRLVARRRPRTARRHSASIARLPQSDGRVAGSPYANSHSQSREWNDGGGEHHLLDAGENGDDYLSLYKTAGIDGLLVEENEIRLGYGRQTIASGSAIFVSADRTKDRFPCRNVRIVKNTVAGGGILLSGNPSSGNVIRGNKYDGPGTAPLLLQAEAEVADNRGFEIKRS